MPYLAQENMDEQAGSARNRVTPGLVVVIGVEGGRTERIIAPPAPVFEARAEEYEATER
jgi:hypothetical protein